MAKKDGKIADTDSNWYKIGRILGRGAYGKVNLAQHKLTRALCAVKSIKKKVNDTKTLP